MGAGWQPRPLERVQASLFVAQCSVAARALLRAGCPRLHRSHRRWRPVPRGRGCGHAGGGENTEFPAYILGTRRTTSACSSNSASRASGIDGIISNQPFEELELRSWQQVLEVSSKPLLTNNQIDAKCEEINAANNHQYSEAEVSKRIEEERKAAASMGKPTALTTPEDAAAARAEAG